MEHAEANTSNKYICVEVFGKICIHVYVCVYMYAYTPRGGEREREIDIYIYIHVCNTYIICISMYEHVCIHPLYVYKNTS